MLSRAGRRSSGIGADAALKALRGITRMKKLTLEQALGLYSKYSELEARANKVMLDVNALYLRDKLVKMKELLKGFSVFASEVSKAMISIANDVKRVMMINNDISKPKGKE
jgi:adenylosuccinate synthase